MFKFFLPAVMTVLLTVNYANAVENYKKIDGLDEIVRLPAGGLVLASHDNGKLMIMSANGRFLVQGGTIFDMWNKGVPITSIQQGKDLAQRVNINSMDLDLDELFSFKFGNLKKERIVVFIDPITANSRKILEQVTKIKSYAVTVVVAPLIKKGSMKLAQSLACLRETNKKAAKDALVSGNFAFLPKKHSCGAGQMQKTLITTQMLGVTGLPFVIAPDGRTFNGSPPDLESFARGQK